jgi:hypothetical protein
MLRFRTITLGGWGKELMQGAKRERWMELCERAAVEQDPKKLLELVTQINELLREKEQRLGIIPPKEVG